MEFSIRWKYTRNTPGERERMEEMSKIHLIHMKMLILSNTYFFDHDQISE